MDPMDQEPKAPEVGASTPASAEAPAEAAAETSAEAAAEGSSVFEPNQVYRIISISEDCSSFDLHEDNLHSIMQEVKKLGDMKLMILSVVGDFRTGKSFLLSSFLRYLYYCETNNTENPEGLGWLKDQENLGGHASTNGPGFLWRGGKERMTTGMLMYGRPFVRTLESGEKVAVLLMDTQGLYDLKTTKDLTTAIFSLTTLISSYQIYNLTKQIQEDKLQQLQFYTEFAQTARKEFEKTKARGKGKPVAGDMFPFQTLDFLVRDWQNFEDDEDIEQCLKEMPEVLSAAMTLSVEDDGTREQIKSAFETLGCFLLPHPGIKITKNNFDGGVGALESNFVQLLDVYVRRVFQSGLNSKKVQGVDVTADSFELFLGQYVSLFKDGKLPATVDLVSAIATATNLSAKQSAMNAYKAEMKPCREGTFMGVDDLLEAHTAAKAIALETFEAIATFGKEEDIRAHRELLLADVAAEFLTIKDQDKLKMHAGLHKYIIPLLAAVIAFFLDWVSDWVCDGWSETCRKFSLNFALLYYVVGLVLAWEFYRIYTANGLPAATLGAMKLGEMVVEKVKEIQDQGKLMMKEGVGSGKEKEE